MTNYRCHDSILRLPSNLFFKSTLQVRTNSKLHPKTASALEFVCTSIDSAITTSSQDYSEEEARTTLEQVSKGLVVYMHVCYLYGLFMFILAFCFSLVVKLFCNNFSKEKDFVIADQFKDIQMFQFPK